jgi:hypothetical protein
MCSRLGGRRVVSGAGVGEAGVSDAASGACSGDSRGFVFESPAVALLEAAVRLVFGVTCLARGLTVRKAGATVCSFLSGVSTAGRGFVDGVSFGGLLGGVSVAVCGSCGDTVIVGSSFCVA